MPFPRSARAAAGLTARILAWVPLLVAAVPRSVSAQSVIPPQLPTFLCQNYTAVQQLAPFVVLIVVAVALIHGLVVRRSSLVVDLVIAGVITLVILNLKTILASFGLGTNC